MKEIEIVIDKDGEVSIDLKGYQGKGCSNISEALANALGTRVKNDKKCEYWQTETKVKAQVRNG